MRYVCVCTCVCVCVCALRYCIKCNIIGSETGRQRAGRGKECITRAICEKNWFKISLHRRKKNKRRLHDSLRFDATQVQRVRKNIIPHYHYYNILLLLTTTSVTIRRFARGACSVPVYASKIVIVL